jgi:hypothetical protein
MLVVSVVGIWTHVFGGVTTEIREARHAARLVSCRNNIRVLNGAMTAAQVDRMMTALREGR